jgi:uncharacterized membrane-anchored protein
MEILLLLLLLQIKHWYADFKIQTYVQTVKKGIWLDPVGMSHTGDHIWGTLVALLFFSFFYTVSGVTIILVAVVEGIAHYIIDYTKVKYGCKDNTKPLFWNQFGLDQLAHQICYLLIAAYIVL